MNFDLVAFIARLRKEEHPAPNWPAQLGLRLVLVFLVARIAALAVVSMLVNPEAAAAGMISPVMVNLAALLAAVVTLAVVWLTLSRRTDFPAAALRLEAYPGSILLMMLFALGFAVLIDFVPLIFGTIGLPAGLIGLNDASTLTWLLAALVVVVALPLVEMVVLQGVLYPALAADRDNLVAILLTGLVYTVLQVFDSPFDLALWVESLLAGLFLTSVRAHQQSTRATVIAASMFGLFALFKVLRLFL
jgi:membrane protease YdiL (CAAX protease family)